MLCKTIHRRDVCTTFFLFKMLIICDIHSRIFLLRREVSRTYHVNTRLRWRVRDPWKGKTSALPLLRVDGKNFRRLRKQPELLRKTVFFCVREVFTVTKIHKSMKRTIEGMDFFSRFFHFKRIQSTNRMHKGNDMTTFLSVTQKFTCRLCSWYFSYTEKYRECLRKQRQRVHQ